MSIHWGDLRFEWDADKARASELEHGIDFADAVTALVDDFGLTREDPDATEEQRFVTVGMTASGVLVVVVYSYRADAVRIISAWKANKWQRKLYEEKRR